MVKIHFRLVQDDDGYPPASVESLWAQPGANCREYVVDNVPFFACDATIGDAVLVSEEKGQRWFKSLVHPSRNSLIRVTFFVHASFEKVNKRLVELGCSTEYSKAHNLLAISVPETVRLSEVQKYLQGEAATGTIDYEEPILRQPAE
jgi:hypothetical protein